MIQKESLEIRPNKIEGVEEMNVVIYVHELSHNQTEQSVESQLKACRDYANRNGFNVVSEYIDNTDTGNIDDRHQFKIMVEDSKARLFQGVLVYQLDKFARNRYDSAIYKAKLKKNGVKLLSARESISDNASGIIIEALFEGIEEYYSADLSMRIRKGLSANAEKGLYTGGNIPYGFCVNNKLFSINKDAAQIVIKIFDMYVSGSTLSEICTYLNTQGIKPQYGLKFNNEIVKRILRNKRYIGTYIHGEIEIPNAIPKIVDEGMFYKVQNMLSMRGTTS